MRLGRRRYISRVETMRSISNTIKFMVFAAADDFMKREIEINVMLQTRSHITTELYYGR
jgi:hypothetical protein